MYVGGWAVYSYGNGSPLLVIQRFHLRTFSASFLLLGVVIRSSIISSPAGTRSPPLTIGFKLQNLLWVPFPPGRVEAFQIYFLATCRPQALCRVLRHRWLTYDIIFMMIHHVINLHSIVRISSHGFRRGFFASRFNYFSPYVHGLLAHLHFGTNLD